MRFLCERGVPFSVMRGQPDCFHPITAGSAPRAVDRLYTNARPETFALPVRALGYGLALDYKQDQRGIQGSHRGALMIDGTLVCPMIPPILANATHHLDDATTPALPTSSPAPGSATGSRTSCI
ncbi:hypothetical protein ACWD7C_25570 [Streptomyces sp. NPDC005134]|uniref:hypothetical protein n=1 Tax=Streptomyces sp. NPDC005098 TaxID=3154560 RepID=UPI0033B34FDE